MVCCVFWLIVLYGVGVSVKVLMLVDNGER